MKRAALAVAVIVLAGCGGGGSAILGGYSALNSCDYAEACVAAVQKASAVAEPSPELMARLLHVRMNTLMKFPPVDDAFLESIGLRRDEGYTGLAAALDRLAAAGDGAALATEARTVMNFLQNPSCENFLALEPVQKGGGMFADSASIAGISALTQILAAITPENTAYVASAMRTLVGCDLSDRAAAGVVVVAAKSRLVELLDACPGQPGGDAIYSFMCAESRKFLDSKSFALPITDGASGETAGAFPPQGRQIGMPINPPWVLSLSAGRLSVFDQPVIAPDALQVPDNVPEVLIDLRDVHRPEDVKTAVHQAVKTRKLWMRPGDERSTFVFMVVDRTTTFSDFSEVVAGLMAETDAFPLVAVLPQGAASPVWRPLNFFMRTRPLFSPDGHTSAWETPNRTGAPGNAEFELTPFSLNFGDRIVEIPRQSAGLVGGGYDVRGVNRLAVELVDGGYPGAFAVKVSSAVTFDMLQTVLEALAYRFPEGAMASPAAFASSSEIRKAVGRYDYLLAWGVLERN